MTAEPGEETVEIDANDKEPELDAVSKLRGTPGIINTRILILHTTGETGGMCQ